MSETILSGINTGLYYAVSITTFLIFFTAMLSVLAVTTTILKRKK